MAIRNEFEDGLVPAGLDGAYDGIIPAAPDQAILVAQAEASTPPVVITIELEDGNVARLPADADITNVKANGLDLEFTQPDGSVIVIAGGAINNLILFVGDVQIPAEAVQLMFSSNGIEPAEGPAGGNAENGHPGFVDPSEQTVGDEGQQNSLLGDTDGPFGAFAALDELSDNLPPTIVSITGDFILADDGLAGGNTPDGESDSATVTGQINAVDPDGVFFSIGVPTGTFSSGGHTITWVNTDPQHVIGTYTIPGDGEEVPDQVVLVAEGSIDINTGVWTITLHQPLDHDHDGATNDALPLPFNFVVTDGLGATTPVTITFTVEDDEPVYAPIEEQSQGGGEGPAFHDGIYAGVVGESSLIDGNPSVDSTPATISGDFSTEIYYGADGKPAHALTTIEVGSATVAITQDGQVITSADAGEQPGLWTLTVDLDGTWTFKLRDNTLAHDDEGDVGAADQVAVPAITATLVDGDDDPIEVTLNIEINDDGPVIMSEADGAYTDVVGESSLGDGNGAQIDGTAKTASGDFSFEVDFGADGKPTHALTTITIGETEIEITADSQVITSADVEQPEGLWTLTVNLDGTWTFELLDNTLAHDDEGLVGAADQVEVPTITATLVDGDGDPIDVTLDIEINDDGPVIKAADPEAPVVGASDLEAMTGTSTASGSLNVSWGADNSDGRSVAFTNASVAVNNAYSESGLTSLGLAVKYALVGDVLVGFTGPGETPAGGVEDASVVFVVTLSDAGDGSYQLDLRQPLDQGDSEALEDGSLDLTFNFTATDADGDPVDGTFTVNVTDTVATINAEATDNGVVEEEQSDVRGAGIDDFGPNADADYLQFGFIPRLNETTRTASGDLGIVWGADNADDEGGQPGDRSVAFADGLIGTLEAKGLESRGSEINYVIKLVGGQPVLFAYTGEVEPGALPANNNAAIAAHIVFTVALSDGAAPADTGSWEFKLYDTIEAYDAQGGNIAGEDLVGFDFSFTATDSDGDTSAPGSFHIDVIDDEPVVIGTILPRFVEEEALSGGNEDLVPGTLAPDGDVGSNYGVTTASTSGSLNILWGGDDADVNDTTGGNGLKLQDALADGQRAVLFAQITGSSDELTAEEVAAFLSVKSGNANVPLSALTSGGEPLVFTLSNNGSVLTASVDGNPVFTVALSDDGLGTFEFKLQGVLDHPVKAGGAANEDVLVFNFKFTAFDGDGDTGTNDFSVSVIDDVPVFQTGADGKYAGTVSESALADGNGDAIDATPKTASGDFTTEVSFGADGEPAHALQSIAIGSNTVLVTADAQVITSAQLGEPAGLWTITVNLDGTWTFELLDNTLNHDENDQVGADDQVDVPTITATLVDGDGDPINVTLDIDINDDGPIANDDPSEGQYTASEGEQQAQNLILAFDVSGSMDENDDGSPAYDSRLEFARAAAVQLIQSSSAAYVLVVTFADDATSHGWMPRADAITFLQSGSFPNPSGGTDYDDALSAIQTAYDASPPDGDTSVYFFSDGEVDGSGALNATELDAWNDFLAANGIESYAVGLGNDVSANDGDLLDVSRPDGSHVIILDSGDSDTLDQLLDTAPQVGGASGNVLANDEFGADGGRILSITVDGETYTWDGEEGTDSLVVETDLGGHFTFNFASGAWTYEASDDVAEDTAETFTYVLVDGDGDTDDATLTINVLAVNDAPVANPDALSVTEANVEAATSGTPITIGSLIANDTDEEGDTLTVTNIYEFDVNESDGGLQIQDIDQVSNSGYAARFHIDTNFGDAYVGISANGDVKIYSDSGEDPFRALGVGQTATISFRYRISDGNGGSDTAIANIVVNGTNDNPDARNDSFSLSENTFRDAELNDKEYLGNLLTQGTDDSDVDGDSLTVTGISAPVLNESDPNLAIDSITQVGAGSGELVRYRLIIDNDGAPDQQAFVAVDADGDVRVWGADNDDPFRGLGVGESATITFDYTISDGHGGTDTATATITIQGSNDTPDANSNAYSVTEAQVETAKSGTPITLATVLGNDTDPDGDTLTVSGVSGFSVNETDSGLQIQSVTELSNSDNGSDVERYRIETNFGTAYVGIAANGVVRIWSDNGEDPFRALGASEHATISFNYTANDGEGGTDSASVTITVDGSNDAPTASNDSKTFNEDTTVTISMNDFGNPTDVDGDTIQSVTITQLETNGSLEFFNGSNWVAVTLNQVVTVADINANKLHFVPDANENGSPYATVKFTVSDGSLSSAEQTLTLNVTAINDAPVNSIPGTQGVNEDTNLVFNAANGNLISISDVDAGGDDVRVTISVQHGTLTLSTVSGLDFDAGANGTGSMTIEGSIAQINAALNGLIYKGSADYFGPDSLSIVTNDLGNNGNDPGLTGNGSSEQDSDSVAINVAPVNDAPTLTLGLNSGVYLDQFGNAAYTNSDGTTIWSDDWDENSDGPENNATTQDILITGGELRFTDSDGDDTSISRDINLSNANSATLEFDYRRAGLDNSNDEVRVYISKDGGSFTLLATIEGPANTGGHHSFDISAYAGPNTVLRFVADEDMSDSPSSGNGSSRDYVYIDNVKVSFTTPTVDYTTSYTENGDGVAIADAAASQVSDVDDANMESALVKLTNQQAGDFFKINGVAAPDGYSVVLSGITYVVSAGGATITLTGSASKAAYEDAIELIKFASSSENPAPTQRIVEVTVNDGDVDSNVAITRINVTPVNDAPVANADIYEVNEDGTLTVLAADGVLDNDTDPENNPLTAELIDDVAHGTLTLNADGSFTYVPTTNYHGPDSFTYRTWDGSAYSAPATVSITVGSIIDHVFTSGVDNVDLGTFSSNQTMTSPDNPYFEDGNYLDAMDGNDYVTLPDTGDGLAATYTTLFANGGIFTGGQGNDTVVGGSLNDRISGGVGADSLYGNNGDDSFFLGQDVTGTGTRAFELGDGTTRQVSIAGLAGTADVVSGGSGTDTLNLDKEGTAGYVHDTYSAPSYLSGVEKINATEGHDVVMVDDAYATALTIDGKGGNDALGGGAAADSILGGGGDDLLSGLGGADTLLGDAGNDEIFGGAGSDSVQGGADNDTIIGGAGADTLEGGTGNDRIMGGDEKIINGGFKGPNEDLAGNPGDIVNLGGGWTIASGTVDLLFVPGQLGANFPAGVNAIDIQGYSNGKVEQSFSTVIGATYTVTFLQSTNPDLLGNTGDTTSSVLVSATGSTETFMHAVPAGTTWGGLAGTFVVRTFTFTATNTTTTLSFEGVQGSGPDYYGSLIAEVSVGLDTPADLGDTISGGDGNDVLYGDAGNDSISGGADNDLIVGGAGDDTASGGTGNDYLSGGKGDDSLSGDAGDDIFVHSVGDGNDRVDGGTDSSGSNPNYDVLHVVGNGTARTFVVGQLPEGGAGDITPADNADDLSITYDTGSIRADEIERVVFDVIAGDTIVFGDVSNTALAPTTIVINSGAGNNTFDFINFTGGTSVVINDSDAVATPSSDTDLVKLGGLWTQWQVTPQNGGAYTLTKGAVSITVTNIESFFFQGENGGAGETIPLSELLEVGPQAFDDAGGPVTEDASVTADLNDVSSVAGNVLSNDTDGNSLDILTVQGAAAGATVSILTGSLDVAIEGTYGTLTIHADGTYTYALSDADPETNALPHDAEAQDVFTYTMRDAAGQTSNAQLVIDVHGTNDAPVIDMTPDVIAIVNNGFELDNNYPYSDPRGQWSNGVPNGWQVGNPAVAGWFDPAEGGAEVLEMEPGNENNVLWLNAGGSASQTLSATALEGTYELTFGLGDRSDIGGMPSFVVRIYAGGTVIAEHIYPSVPVDGLPWTTLSLSGSVAEGSPLIGQQLKIEFANLEGGQIDIDNVNLTLSPDGVLPTLTEDDVDTSGVTVASILGATVSDVDTGAIEGIAITGQDDGNGTWQYHNGTSWVAFGAVDETSALHLKATDLVRFVPNGENGTAASFEYRAWDQTNSTPVDLSFTKGPVGAGGGTSAYSTATDTASIAVTSVNDAPVVEDQFASLSEPGDIMGILEAGPHGGYEPGYALSAGVQLSLEALVASVNPHPENVEALLNALTAPGGELVGDLPSALAYVWDFLDDKYGSVGPNVPAINEAMVRLGVVYANYVKNGGMPFNDIVAKFVADNGDADTLPQRNQSLHDNLLGNLQNAALSQRFDSVPATKAAMIALITGVDPDLLTRAYYEGTQGGDPSAVRAWDIANNFVPHVSGHLVASDVDANDPVSSLTWNAGTYSGDHGTLVIQANGDWNYQLDITDPAVIALSEGSTLPETFTITASDGEASTSASLSITINGTNDAPVINAANTIEFVRNFDNANDTIPDADEGRWGQVVLHNSGSNNIVTADGSQYALFERQAGSNPYTFFDGPRSTWTGEWMAQVKVYLDINWADGSGFDYSVAASGTDGLHQRDFIFHVAKDDSTDKLLVAGSNNSSTNNSVRDDLESIPNHAEVTQTGWYTLQHRFYDVGGVLKVDLSLIDANGTVLFTETRTASADTIPAEVGGNYYGWFPVLSVPGGVAVDAMNLNMSGTSTMVRELSDGAAGEGTETLSTAGTIPFGDVDLTDVHTVTYALLDATHSISGAVAARGTFATSVANDSTGDGTGSIGYTFNVNDGAIEDLGAGQTITQVYRVTLQDGHGGLVTHDVTVTLVGRNDAPEITSIVTPATVIEAGDIAGMDEAGLGGKFEPSVALNALIAGNATITSTLANLQTAPEGVADALTTIAAELGGPNGLIQAYAVIWDYLDDAYQLSAFQPNVNEAFIRLGIAYASAVEAGSLESFIDVVAKFTADNNNDGIPQRFQSLHDNLLGNLRAASLDQRFGPSSGTPDALLLAELTLAINGVNPNLLTREYFEGNQGDDSTAERLWDLQNGYVPQATGQLTATDVDTGHVLTWSASPAAGTYGSFAVDANGKWTFTLDNSLAATQGLAQGQTGTQDFTVTVTDQFGASDAIVVTVNVTGTNDAPVITSNVLTTFTGGVLSSVIDADTAPGFNFEPVINHDVAINAALLANLPDMAAVIAAVNLADGGTPADAIAWVWDYLDNGYVANGPYQLPINEAFARLGVEYARYLETGGTPLYGLSAKYTADGADDGGAPDRLQTLHDNLLGNLGAPALAQRFTGPGDAVYDSIVNALNSAGVSDLLQRPYYAGNEGDTNNALLWDQLHGYLPAASGQVSATDVDSNAVLTFTGTAEGNYGSFVVGASGAWTYTINTDSPQTQALAQGNTATESFVVKVTDDKGGFDTITITVTATGINDVPVLVADSETVADTAATEAGTPIASGNLFGNDDDADGDTLTMITIRPEFVSFTPVNPVGTTTVVGLYGSLTVEADGDYVYTPNAAFDALAEGQAVVDKFKYGVSDGHGGVATEWLTVNITGGNEVPTFVSVSASVGEDGPSLSVNLITAANAADVDGTPSATNVQTQVTTTGNRVLDLGTHYTFSGNTLALTAAGFALFNSLKAAASDSFTLTYDITDGIATAQNTVTVTINGANDAPSDLVDSDLDANNVAENAANGTLVQLTASSGDIDFGDTLTYSLTNNAGGRFAIDGTTGVVTVANGTLLDYEVATSHLITVQVSDGNGGIKTSNFTINLDNLSEINLPPVATEGAYAVGRGYSTSGINSANANPIIDLDFLFPTMFVDPENSLVWSIPGLPANGFAFDASTNTLSFDNSIVGPGVYTFVVNAFDGLTTVSQTVKVFVAGSKTTNANQTFTTGDDSNGISSSANNWDGNNGHDYMDGGGQNDTISGGNGDDVIYGGTENDSLSGTNGSDYLNGESGDDTLSGGNDGDWLEGGIGADRLRGDSGSDTLSGGSGNDNLDGGSGNDLVYGGAGDDTITETSSGNNTLYGGAGNDTITGGGNTDRIYGGDDNDVLDAGGGDAEYMDGGSGNDSITGTSNADTIYGGAGNDTINSSGGDDWLDGGDGDDLLISTNWGLGTINGGAGSDTLTGGSGPDRFVFANNDAMDLVTDFATGNSNPDVLDLSALLTGYSAATRADHVRIDYENSATDHVLSDAGNGPAVDGNVTVQVQSTDGVWHDIVKLTDTGGNLTTGNDIVSFILTGNTVITDDI